MQGFFMRAFIRIVSYLVYVVSFYVLQYFLSTRENRWLGWILPSRYFLMGVSSAFNPTTLPVVTAFLLGGGCNCAIHIIIYCIGRDKVRRRRADQLQKMSIQDLG